MSQETLTPEVRFEGYEDDLTTMKLTDTFEVIRNAFVGTATPFYVDNGNFYLQSNNIKNGQINRTTEVFINDFFYESQKNKWLHTNDLVMVQSGHVGHTAVIPESLNNTSAHALIIFSKNKGLTDPYFLNYQFMSPRVNKEIETLAIGNTIKHILASSMRTFEVKVPGMVEQAKVGQLFKKLDLLINKKAAELQKNESFKQAMLQKMFPKEGESVPEVRFEGFDKKWKERAMSTITNSHNNLRVPITSSDRTQGNTPYYGANGIQDYVEGFTHNGSFVLLAEDGANDLSDYPVRFVEGEIWVNNHAHVLSGIKNEADNKYLSYALKTIDMAQYLVGGSRYKLNANTLKNIGVSIPGLDEQRLIGQYFYNLDKHIQAKQAELNKLKQFKQAMLSKLFV